VATFKNSGFAAPQGGADPLRAKAARAESPARRGKPSISAGHPSGWPEL